MRRLALVPLSLLRPLVVVLNWSEELRRAVH